MKAFDLTLPPGFVRFSLPRKDDSALRDFVLSAVRDVSEEQKAQVAGGLYAGVGGLMDSLAEQGFFVMYFAAPSGLLAMQQPTLCFRPLVLPAELDPLEVLMASAAQSPDTELLDIEPAVCLRTATINPVDTEATMSSAREDLDLVDTSDSLADLDLHQVRCIYQLGVPGVTDSWFEAVAVATIPVLKGSNLALAEATELFDAILGTFRWVDDA